MLTARGATRWQLVGLTAAEAIPLCVLSAAAGGVVGVLLARLLAGTGPAGGAWHALGGAAAAAAVVAAGALVIMLVPALSTVTPGTARARRGRQSAISGVARAGADVALILLAVLAGWQLRHYSAVSAGANGNFGLDPVVVIAPALALAGGTVAALRLLPAGGRAGDRLAARGRRLTAALASWQISRQPIRQGGAALLIVLAVATGTLALAQRQSWTRSDHDQAAFSSGADVRVETSEPLSAAQAAGLIRVPGVRHAMPVAIFPQNATHGETLAVDARQAADVTLLRADQSPLPLASALREDRAQHAGTGRGAARPRGRGPAHRAARARIAGTGSGHGERLGRGRRRQRLRARRRLAARRRQEPHPGRHPGQPGRRGREQPARPGTPFYPLRLLAVTLDYTLPAVRPRGPAVFTLAGVSGGPGKAQVPGAVLRGWATVASSAELAGVRQVGGTSGPSGLPAVTARAARGTALAVALNPGYGLAAGPYPGVPPSPIAGQLAVTGTSPVTALPGLATQRFLAASNASVGSTVQTDIDGMIMNVKIVAAVATFPTVSASGGALIVDLGRVQDILTSNSVEAAPVTQWWLATPAPSGSGPGLAADLPPGSAITSTTGVAAGLLSDPLSTVPQQALLAVAIAAAVLAITGFCVSIAAGVRQRRAENALLAALGVPPRAAAGQLCLEKLMLSLPSALAGLVLGVVLAELLVPAITLTSSATTPMPPVLIQFSWSQILLLALAVAVLPVLTAAVTIARRPDAAAELRATEVGVSRRQSVNGRPA